MRGLNREGGYVHILTFGQLDAKFRSANSIDFWPRSGVVVWHPLRSFDEKALLGHFSGTARLDLVKVLWSDGDFEKTEFG